jgi:hypothetical protein
MKRPILLIFFFTISHFGHCQEKESLKIELHSIVKNKVPILKIKLTNCSSKGLFFPDFSVYDILIFFDSNGVNISDSASYLSTRVSCSTKFIELNDILDGDIIVCRITSQIYSSEQDVFIENWKSTGLKLPSIIRVNKIATLDKKMAEKIMRKIDESLQEKS